MSAFGVIQMRENADQNNSEYGQFLRISKFTALGSNCSQIAYIWHTLVKRVHKLHTYDIHSWGGFTNCIHLIYTREEDSQIAYIWYTLVRRVHKLHTFDIQSWGELTNSIHLIYTREEDSKKRTLMRLFLFVKKLVLQDRKPKQNVHHCSDFKSPYSVTYNPLGLNSWQFR